MTSRTGECGYQHDRSARLDGRAARKRTLRVFCSEADSGQGEDALDDGLADRSVLRTVFNLRRGSLPEQAQCLAGHRRALRRAAIPGLEWVPPGQKVCEHYTLRPSTAGQ